MGRIKVRRYRIGVPESCGEIKKPVRVVMIGDLHNRKFGDGNSQLVDKIISLRPDLILSVGDLVICKKKKKKARTDVGLRLIKRLSMECPVYGILGNHEKRAKTSPEDYEGVYQEIRRGWKGRNLYLLEDASLDVEAGGCRISIHGLDLPLEYFKKIPGKKFPVSELSEHVQIMDPNRFQILLAHTPQYFDTYAKWGADLTLCGHFHGGMIRLPLLGGLISPQLRLFPKYDCGLFEKEGKKMLVTAGLGTHSFGPRINNPAEVTFLELYSEKEEEKLHKG